MFNLCFQEATLRNRSKLVMKNAIESGLLVGAAKDKNIQIDPVK